MIVDISLAILAALLVLFGVAGKPSQDGRFTAVGIGIILAASITLMLSVWKSISDERTANERAAKIEELKEEYGKAQESAIKASEETTKLKSAILATFETIRIENDELILQIPSVRETIIKKRKTIFGFVEQGRVIVKKTNIDEIDEVKRFQSEMDQVEADLLKKIENIESIYKLVQQ